MRHADIGWIDVAVDVEIADFPVPLLAHVIGEPAERQQVVRLEERETVLAERRSPARTFCAMGSRRLSVICRSCRHSWSRKCYLVEDRPGLKRRYGCITNAAAPQKSKNNKLI